MPRAKKTYNGAISDVADPTKHAAGYRVRFRHNGVWTASYRTTKKDAETLHKELSDRAAVAAVNLNMAPTWMNQEQVKNAEMAYRTLINGNLVNQSDPTSYQAIIKAAEKIVQAMDQREEPIAIRSAYELFKKKQATRGLAASTLRDYDRFLDPFIEKVKPTTDVRTISGQACKDYITSHQDAARFKCHGYMVAFFKFCAGKNNPYILPGDPAWIKASPVNFEKQGYTPKNIHSYTLAEIKTLLVAAKKSGALGYILFRLYSMVRYEELLRFQKDGIRFDKHPAIDLKNLKIHLSGSVFRKRSKKAARGRHIPIDPCFRVWINYCIRHKLRFNYDRVPDQEARRAVKNKWGTKFKNMLRHTAITMRVKRNDEDETAMVIAAAAGTSTAVIETNYLNLSISPKDAKRFYKLSPRSFGWS